MAVLKKIINILLRFGVSAGLLFFLFRKIDLKAFVQIIKRADFTLILLSFFVFCLIYALCFLRWHKLLRALGVDLPIRPIFSSFMGGVFFNAVLPSTIGGDVLRSVDLSAKTKRPDKIIATVFVDRLSGYTGLSLVCFGLLIFGWKLVNTPSVIIHVILITGLLCLILLVLFNDFLYRKITGFLEKSSRKKQEQFPKVVSLRQHLVKLHQQVYYFRSKPKVVIERILLSIIIQIISSVSFYILFLSLGIKINIVYCLIFQPIIGAITLIPISIGGLGLRDNMTRLFYSKVGIDSSFSIAASLVTFTFIIIGALVGGLVYYVLTVRHRRVQSAQ